MTPLSTVGATARAATMRDVAAVAGVSLKTVSRVVNREAGVSADLAGRVTDAVDLLGYRHNHAASSLRRSDRRSSTIGLLLEDVANPFDSALHRTVEDVARSYGCLVLTGSSDADPQREREMLQAFASRKIDGLISVPAGRDQTAMLHEQRLGTPVVFVDRPDPSGLADSVAVDNRWGAELAVAHLAAVGHRRIAFLGDRRELFSAAERLAGYRQGLLRLGVAPFLTLERLDVGGGSERAQAAVTQLLDLAEPPTALFTGQNLITVGAVRALQERGQQHQVALVGFDDFPLADLLDPGVSVVTQDVAEIGRLAAELLFVRIGGAAQPAQVVTVAPVLTVRGSGEIPVENAPVQAGRRGARRPT